MKKAFLYCVLQILYNDEDDKDYYDSSPTKKLTRPIVIISRKKMSSAEFKIEFDRWKDAISERKIQIDREMERLIEKTKEKIRDKMFSVKRETLIKMVKRFNPHMMKNLREEENPAIMARQEAYVIDMILSINLGLNGKEHEFISLAKEFKVETNIEDMMSDLDEILKEYRGMRFVAIADAYETDWSDGCTLPHIPPGEIELWEKE